MNSHTILRRAAVILLATGFVGTLFGYSRSGHAMCSGCGAQWNVHERGVALSDGLRLPILSHAEMGEVPPWVGRFLPSGHVHDRDVRFGGASTSGPYLTYTISCPRRLPWNRFAGEVWLDPKFAEYVAARVADGTASIDDVRALLALPPDAAAPEPLRRTADALYIGFHGPDPVRAVAPTSCPGPPQPR